MRLAWFSPWPPDRSGVAGRSAEVVPRLAERGHGIDVFVDERRVAVSGPADVEAPAPGNVRVLGAHDFVWLANRGSYDLIIYQVGNSRLHEFIWPYLFRWPGLSVLHDARLHHARARARLARGDVAAYRAEFAWSHPNVSPDAAELAIAGLSGAYYYQWPMVRGVLESSRLVATHAPDVIDPADTTPDSAPLEHIRLGEGDSTRAAAQPAIRQAFRAAHGIAPDDVVFGVFGSLSEYRRIDTILQGFASVHATCPGARLVMAGSIDPGLPAREKIDALGLRTATLVDESPGDEQFDRWITAVDVSLNLRWPTSREVSGPWLRALAAGRATVILDLAQTACLPTLDPRTWQLHAPAAAPASAAVAVAVDILDEEHSLRRAMLGLASDAALRESLGRTGHEYWQAHHTMAHMVADYERAMARAAAQPSKRPAVPPFLRPDPVGHARALLEPFGGSAARSLDELVPPGAGSP